MLHIVKSLNKLDLALQYRLNGDDILLVESATYAGNPKYYRHALLKRVLDNVFLLEEDVIARGILNLISDHISLISFDDFVELTAKHAQSISW
ncbi:tusB protein [Candidatus Photodesmus blepharus]|uniref:TusB protein n=1 Tax=Candidatus Photodesmus blepharonis TaxID=1179155 RepID=A0A084CNQ2_9GAMM|nr:sulfurtransferase complex subunit TusB [Candidatus Photodesmus blepharus]KEY91431.1 tusB protein [Candidatus Photodesmus blepharus]